MSDADNVVPFPATPADAGIPPPEVIDGTSTLPPEIEAFWCSLDNWQRDRFMHFAMRIANNDATAHRYARLRAEGKITLRQLLERM